MSTPAAKAAAVAAPRKRLCYWFVDRVSPRHRELAAALLKRGYATHFFTSTASFFAETKVHRAGIVLIDDVGPKSQIEAVIQGCVSLPELQGVRLILTTNTADSDLRQQAAWGAFRDILSLGMDDANFVRRFTFSTSNKSAPMPIPLPSLAANQISAVCLPIRVVWLTEKRIRIEGRLAPTVGSVITLFGNLAENMGMTSISIFVEELHKSFLQYRFSDAVVGSWSIPEAGRSRAKQTLDFLKAKNLGQKRRVFVAAHSTAFRNEILNYLKGPHFEVKAALQKQSIVDEPRFFNPDVIFIEDSLCREGDLDRLKAMVDGVSNDLTIIVKGTQIPRATLQKSVGRHQLVVCQQIPSTIADIVLNRYANGTHRHAKLSDQDAIHILPEDKNSLAQIRVVTRMTRIHPLAVQMALPFPIGSFGICKIEAPILTKAIGRSPFAKVTGSQSIDSSEANPFPYAIDCYLADTSQEEQRVLAKTIHTYFADQLNLSLSAAVPGALARDVEGAPPEAVDSASLIPATPEISSPQVSRRAAWRPEPATVRKRKKATNPFAPLKYVAAFSAVGLGFAAFIWLIIKIASTDYEKSGGQYTDSLRKMAPERFKTGEENNPDAH